MWRATVLAATFAVALGGAATDLAAQGNGKGKAKASERFERKDQRGREAARSGRVTAREVTQEDRRTRDRTLDDVIFGDRRDRDRRVYDRDRDRRVYDRDSDRDSDSDRYDRRGRKQGPSFCRSGAGHPTKGRQWCVQKGYGLGNDSWRNVRWEDVVFGRPDRRYDYDTGRIGGSVLEDILGRVVFGRLSSQADRLGGGSLYGNWLSDPAEGRVLQVFAGSRPLAEFVDRNRDGRADRVFLNYGR